MLIHVWDFCQGLYCDNFVLLVAHVLEFSTCSCYMFLECSQRVLQVTWMAASGEGRTHVRRWRVCACMCLCERESVRKKENFSLKELHIFVLLGPTVTRDREWNAPLLNCHLASTVEVCKGQGLKKLCTIVLKTIKTAIAIALSCYIWDYKLSIELREIKLKTFGPLSLLIQLRLLETLLREARAERWKHKS